MLPEIGCPDFVPELIGYIQDELDINQEWEFDPSIFSALLLSSIVGRRYGGVIVDVLPSEGEDGVRRTAEHVQAITSGIFGLETRHVHFPPDLQPSDLSELLFDPSSAAHKFKKSSSIPRSASTISHQRDRQSEKPSNPYFPSRLSSRQPSITSTHSASRYSSALSSPLFQHTSQTHPRPASDQVGVADGQRRSSSFLTPQVTPKTSQSPILNSLGVTQIVDSPQKEVESVIDENGKGKISVPDCIVISGLERCISPIWIKLVEIIITRKFRMGGSGEEIEFGEKDFWVVWVKEEDMSEKCPGYLIDQFTCSTCIHPDDLHSPPHLKQRSIIPSNYLLNLNTLLDFTHIHPPLQIHISNLLSAVLNHPKLEATMTGKAVSIFPKFVKAHRLLSAPFDLPEGWELGLKKRRDILMGVVNDRSGVVGSRKGGFGQGRNGGQDEDSWGLIAGEEPLLIELITKKPSKRIKIPEDEEGGDEEEEDEELEEWYCLPNNVEAVFMLCLRHRVSFRSERKEIMWLLKGSARGHLDIIEKKGERRGKRGEAMVVDGTIKVSKGKERRRRREVDIMMEEVLKIV